MSRICINTRGASDWRDRLANPQRQWKRGYSAFEAAVSWELAARLGTGIPEPIEKVLAATDFAPLALRLAIAEHKVELAGDGHDSQTDVWAWLHSAAGDISVSVEAKARESFGKTLAAWLVGRNARSTANRRRRWKHVEANLPRAVNGDYSDVPYQLLHRCATAVIEARRLGFGNGLLVVQAFGSPTDRYQQFEKLCTVVGLQAARNTLLFVDGRAQLDDVRTAVAWIECPMASDREIAAVA